MAAINFKRISSLWYLVWTYNMGFKPVEWSLTTTGIKTNSKIHVAAIITDGKQCKNEIAALFYSSYDEVTDLNWNFKPMVDPLNDFGMNLNFAQAIFLTNGTL